MNELIGQALETARKHFLNTHGDFYKFASHGDRGNLEFWLDSAKEDPIKHSVHYAAATHFIDSNQLVEEMEASLRFRVLAGILTRPIDYEDADDLNGGICDCQEYDPETGGWPCKVPGNQAQADAWHEKFGNGPACPFWKNPSHRNPMERSETELERLFMEGSSLEDAWQQLGLKTKRH